MSIKDIFSFLKIIKLNGLIIILTLDSHISENIHHFKNQILTEDIMFIANKFCCFSVATLFCAACLVCLSQIILNKTFALNKAFNFPLQRIRRQTLLAVVAK